MFLKGLRKLEVLFVIISAAALIYQVCVISLDVFLRAVFNRPLPGTMEIGQLVLPYIIFLPFAFALSDGAHVRVTIVSGKLRGRLRKLFDAVAFGATFVFFCILAYWSLLHFWDSFVIREIMLASITLPLWLGKLAMPLGLFLIVGECIYQLKLIFSRKEE